MAATGSTQEFSTPGRLRRAGRRAGRGCLALVLTGGWVLLAVLPVGAAALTWWDGLS